MLVIPAIDIRHGQCVRLYQGQDGKQTLYGKDPLEMAQKWKSRGATHLHIADLDGAFEGKPVNLAVVARMRKETGLPVQLGGGFRNLASIEAAVTAGIDRIILGTIAVSNPDLVQKAAQRYGAQITVSIDVAEDYVAVSGWTSVSKVRYDELAIQMREAGVQELLFTDTRKDGTLSGPNIEGIRAFLAAARVPVTASGGITTVADIEKLKELVPSGLRAVVIGKALYDDKITLEDALRAAR